MLRRHSADGRDADGRADRRFRQRYPGVELKIAEFGGLTVQQAVSNGELDMAMTALPVEEDSSLTILPLFNHRCAS